MNEAGTNDHGKKRKLLKEEEEEEEEEKRKTDQQRKIDDLYPHAVFSLRLLLSRSKVELTGQRSWP